MDKLDFNKELSDDEIIELIDEVIATQSKTRTIEIGNRGRLKKDIFYSIRKCSLFF